MAGLIAYDWVTPTGIRLTQTGKTHLAVGLQAFCDLAPLALGGVGGVTFLRFNITGPTSFSADCLSTERDFLPNYSRYASPLPGVVSGMARVPFVYHFDFDGLAVPGGTYTVTAEVFTDAGFLPVPGSIKIYNDTDGVDRRFQTQERWVDADSGNDANPGTQLSPMAEIQTAVDSIISATGGDLGDCIIHLVNGSHIWANGSVNSPCFTQDESWLTIRVHDDADIITDGAQLPQGGYFLQQPKHILYLRGSASIRVKLELELQTEKQIAGVSCIVSVEGQSLAQYWLDGGRSGSNFHDEISRPYSVRFYEDDVEPIGFLVPNAAFTRRVSCHRREGVRHGFAGMRLVHECRVSNFLGIALQPSGVEAPGNLLSILPEDARYDHEVAGFIRCTLANCSISNVAGRMRINQAGTVLMIGSGASIDISEQCSEIIGSIVWSILVAGDLNPENNGNFPVLAVGPDWIELDNPAAVSSSNSSTTIETARAHNAEPYVVAIHPDITQYNGFQSNTITNTISPRNIKNAQAWYAPGGMHQCVIVNVTDGGHNIVSPILGNVTGCIFAHISLAGPWDFSGSASFAGTYFVNCAITTGNIPAGSAATYYGCHFVLISGRGTSPTTGIFFANPTSVSPWDMSPLPAWIGGGYSGIPEFGVPPDSFLWPGTLLPTKGAMPQVAQHLFTGGSALVVASGIFGNASLNPLSGSAIVSPVGFGRLPSLEASPLQASVGSIVNASFPSACIFSPLDVLDFSAIVSPTGSFRSLVSTSLAGTAKANPLALGAFSSALALPAGGIASTDALASGAFPTALASPPSGGVELGLLVPGALPSASLAALAGSAVVGVRASGALPVAGLYAPAATAIAGVVQNPTIPPLPEISAPSPRKAWWQLPFWTERYRRLSRNRRR